MITTETQNERSKGRAVPAVPLHTFQDSGIVVKLHKLSPMTSQEIILQVQREMAGDKPIAPVFEVDYGKGKVEEPNYSHPIYVKRLEEWDQSVNREANDRLFRLAALAAVELTGDQAWRDKVKRQKRLLKLTAKLEWHDDPELEPEENDQIFYVKHVCCASPDDVREFYQAITQRSQPTEAAVEAHKQSFPGDVQGPLDLEL